MHRLDSICQPDYYPTDDDIVRSRTRTSGVHHLEFTYQNRKYQYKLIYLDVLMLVDKEMKEINGYLNLKILMQFYLL